METRDTTEERSTDGEDSDTDSSSEHSSASSLDETDPENCEMSQQKIPNQELSQCKEKTEYASKKRSGVSSASKGINKKLHSKPSTSSAAKVLMAEELTDDQTRDKKRLKEKYKNSKLQEKLLLMELKSMEKKLEMFKKSQKL